jgi:DNA-directed RNA polymerase specialized sigma24 family protein
MAFPETEWSALALATAHGDQSARQAMDELCRRYWQPVFKVICSRGMNPEGARDRTQSFFLYLLENSTLRRVNRTRGRFRTFLLTVLWRFLRDEQRRATADKRGGELEDLPLEENTDDLPSTPSPLSELLDREWAMTTMQRAIDAVGREFVAKRGETAWTLWKGFLPGSSTVPSMSAAAAAMGISEASARAEIHRLRNRCREALRRELMITVSSPEDLDDEIRYLGRALQVATNATQMLTPSAEVPQPAAES